MNWSACEWSDVSSQELKQVFFFGRPHLLPLDSSIPSENLVDIGSDWDYGLDFDENQDVVNWFLVFWCEQTTEVHVQWFPLLCYRIICYDVPNIDGVGDAFSRTFLGNLNSFVPRLQDTYEEGYCYLLFRAAGIAAKKLYQCKGGHDAAVALDSVRILGG